MLAHPACPAMPAVLHHGTQPLAESDLTLLTCRYSPGIYDGRELSEDEITGMLIAVLFAGQHTSSITSTWTSLELFTHPVSHCLGLLDNVQRTVVLALPGCKRPAPLHVDLSGALHAPGEPPCKTLQRCPALSSILWLAQHINQRTTVRSTGAVSQSTC